MNHLTADSSTESSQRPSSKRSRWQALALALAAFALVFVLWQIPNSGVLYPFRLLVTFVHETGHGLTALITGGGFDRFVVMETGSGIATTRGGSHILILQMGYLGAALFGSVLLYLANSIQRVKLLAMGMGAFFIICAVLYTGNGPRAVIGPMIMVGLWLLPQRSKRWRMWLYVLSLVVVIITFVLIRTDIALMVGVLTGALLIGLARYATPRVIIFCLDTLALITAFNAISDIQVLFNNRMAGLNSTPNDALALANYTHTPVELWIILWIGLSLFMVILAIYKAFFRPSNTA
jgi:hypothetical protein